MGMVLLKDLTKMNYRHDAIVLWLVQNPDRLLADCAEYFGYTQAWLSRIVNSDMFQAAYREKCQELGAIAVHSVGAKLGHLAATAIDKSVERIEKGLASERFLADSAKTALTAIGYGGPSTMPQINNAPSIHIHVDASRLERARERAASQHAGTTALKQGPTQTPGPQAQSSEQEDGLILEGEIMP
ncbi:MAG TPA: hypothetical protein VF077_00315 [Nitrospiraceae bacterium]